MAGKPVRGKALVARLVKLQVRRGGQAEPCRDPVLSPWRHAPSVSLPSARLDVLTELSPVTFHGGSLVKKILMFIAAMATGATAQTATARPEVRVSQVSADRFELILSGTRFSSRDEAERALLLSAARLALAHGNPGFVLLALPGEQSDMHPPRGNAGFGRQYGHWQPHWTYRLRGEGWQWWHPEWGAAFWTADVDPARVEAFEVHAMIELGTGRSPGSGTALPFTACDVVRDLRRLARPAVPH